jgi:serine/threonine-protein kinase
MSPEQAGVTGLDIDTRADIYSLGVLLFELLAGVPPVDHARLREARPSEIEQLLFAADVPRPSQRARTAALQRELRGDLDWIVLKAMERDRERRYATVSDLAADIARYFAHEAVMAGAPTTIYRVKKFVARHRTGVAVAAALALAIVGALVVTLVQSERTRRALAVAEAERARAEQVAGFLVDLFEVSDPGEVRGNAVTAREILDQGAKKIETSLADQPDMRARIMATIGAVFRNLGLYERADALLSESLALRRQTLGPDHADVAATLTDLAGTNRLRGRLKEALAQHQEALALRQRLLGPDHADVSQSLNNICSVQNQLGDRAAARQACEQAIALRERAGDALALATSIQNLGNTYELDGKFDVAETHYRRALDLRRRELGDAHLETARAKSLLGMIVYRQGRNREAAALYREALPILRAVLDATHPTVITTVSNLALVQRQEGDLAGADASLREVIAARRARLGDRHPEVAVATNNLAFVVKDRGDLPGAVTLFAEALEIFRAALGENHVNYANVLHNLAEAQFEAGDPAASRNASDALARKLKALPRTHQSVGQSLSLVGHLRAEGGDAAGAEPMLREALETLRKSLPDTHARVAQAKGRLGSCLLRQGKNAEAAPLLREALKVLDVPASAREARWIESRLKTLPASAGATR